MVEHNTGRRKTETNSVSRRKVLKAIGAGSTAVVGLSGTGSASHNEGKFEFHLFPRTPSEYSFADNEIRWALWDAFEHLFLESQSYNHPYKGLSIVVHDDYPDLSGADENTGDIGDDFYNVVDEWDNVYKSYTWTTDIGSWFLIDSKYEYADVVSGTSICDPSDPPHLCSPPESAFVDARSGVIGVGGDANLARSLAVHEALHNLIDSDIPDVDNMIDDHEHDLGSIRYGPGFDGEVTPLADLYAGGWPSDIWEDYNSGSQVEYHVEHGSCQFGKEDWKGGFTMIPSECTIDAVRYSRNYQFDL